MKALSEELAQFNTTRIKPEALKNITATLARVVAEMVVLRTTVEGMNSTSNSALQAQVKAMSTRVDTVIQNVTDSQKELTQKLESAVSGAVSQVKLALVSVPESAS
jgi:hypothetical protein